MIIFFVLSFELSSIKTISSGNKFCEQTDFRKEGKKFSSLCAGTTMLKFFIYISVFFNGLYVGRITPWVFDFIGTILFE